MSERMFMSAKSITYFEWKKIVEFIMENREVFGYYI